MNRITLILRIAVVLIFLLYFVLGLKEELTGVYHLLFLLFFGVIALLNVLVVFRKNK